MARQACLHADRVLWHCTAAETACMMLTYATSFESLATCAKPVIVIMLLHNLVATTLHAAVKVTCIAVQMLQGSIYCSTTDALEQAA